MTKFVPAGIDPTGIDRPSTDLSGRVSAAGIIGIVRSADPATALAAGTTLLAAGLDVVEISLVTPDALQVITELIAQHPSALIGAGTVLTGVEAAACVAAGARLLVSPTVEPEVIGQAGEAGILAIPGANTPTECVTAARLGAPLVKLFPASTWSPASVADLLSSLPALRLVPTGGVRVDDAERWFQAGAAALGIGSALTSGSPQECRDRVTRLHQARTAARS